jgi:hypothetical protein
MAEKIKTLVRLGKEVPNRARGGSIVCDAIVPELIEKGDVKVYLFDWEKLFDNVSTEEMVMRRGRREHWYESWRTFPPELQVQRLMSIRAVRVISAGCCFSRVQDWDL